LRSPKIKNDAISKGVPNDVENSHIVGMGIRKHTNKIGNYFDKF